MQFFQILCALAAGTSTVRALGPHYTSTRAIENSIESRDPNAKQADLVSRRLEDDDKNYKYIFQELQPQTNGRGSNEQPYYHIMLLFKKRPDVTEEYFHMHWKTVHADLTVAGKNIGIMVSRYVQVSSRFSCINSNVLIPTRPILLRTNPG